MESNLRQDVRGFLSSNTQDFIEVGRDGSANGTILPIPEL